VLRTEGLSIRFGGHVAVDQVSCEFLPGSLTAIVGPNGAGKTTYFNLISGQLRASSGRVLLEGLDLSGMPAAERTLLGLGRAFQLTNLFPQLSVHENVRLAVQARSRIGVNWWSIWSSHRALIDEADALIERLGLIAKRNEKAASLPHGDQRKLEVGILMALQPKVFMFDEPTAGMSVEEVPVILDLIRQIRQDTSKTVLLVEHKMDVVRELSDRIIVLHNGQLVADGEPNAVIASPIVQQAYLGVELDASVPLVGA
jgi:branched-chain amino acid transport system ATP-binding protein